jgi:flagellar protein FliT
MGVEMSVLSCYESIADASAEMVSAARRADWDALIVAEQECARRIETLKVQRAAASLDAAADKRRHDIIRTVLAHDAEIRALTQPWMTKLELLLNGAAAGRRVEQAYR